MNMKITKKNTVFFHVHTRYRDRKYPTQLGAVHAGSDKSFGCKLKPGITNVRGLESFKAFLKKVNGGKPVVLAAHNCHKFDRQVLEIAATTSKIRIPPSLVKGYCDALTAMKKSCKTKTKTYTMEDLAKTFSERKKRHDAVHDSELLKRLTEKVMIKSGKKTISEFFDGAYKPNHGL
jgi:hypothetical protein